MNHDHPAVSKAIDIYDRPGDLLPYQAEFTAKVHAIRLHASETVSDGIFCHGYGSEAAIALANLVARQEAHDLDCALLAFEEALEEA
jgi:hypothetical protein